MIKKLVPTRKSDFQTRAAKRYEKYLLVHDWKQTHTISAHDFPPRRELVETAPHDRSVSPDRIRLLFVAVDVLFFRFRPVLPPSTWCDLFFRRFFRCSRTSVFLDCLRFLLLDSRLAGRAASLIAALPSRSLPPSLSASFSAAVEPSTMGFCRFASSAFRITLRRCRRGWTSGALGRRRGAAIKS